MIGTLGSNYKLLMIGNNAKIKSYHCRCRRRCCCRCRFHWITIQLAKTNAPKTNNRKLCYAYHYIVQCYKKISKQIGCIWFGVGRFFFLSFFCQHWIEVINCLGAVATNWIYAKIENFDDSIYYYQIEIAFSSILPMDNDKRALKPLFKIQIYNWFVYLCILACTLLKLQQ